MSKIITLDQGLELVRKHSKFEEIDPTHWDDGPFHILSWRDYAELYDSIPPPKVPYIKETFDCDKYTRRTIALANEQWAYLCLQNGTQPLPLFHGVLGGNVPIDGDASQTGWHSLIFSLCDDEKLLLYGAQMRAFFNNWVIDDVKEIDTFDIG